MQDISIKDLHTGAYPPYDFYTIGKISVAHCIVLCQHMVHHPFSAVWGPIHVSCVGMVLYQSVVYY